jgi:hypothetical protein
LRTLPLYGWLGLLVMVVSEAGMLARIPPFFHWHTPIAWTGYILFVDALVWKRRGNSWLRDDPAELFFMAVVSIPLWVIFEIYNKYFLHNWYYIGLPETMLLRYFGYAWSFATIWPAIMETAELVSSLRDRRAPHSRADMPRPESLGMMGWLWMIAGAAMLALPIAWPSPYLAAPVWLGFIFLLDPLNAHAGDKSILRDLREGDVRRLTTLLIAGLVCGFVWEFWNYWGGTKWIYNVPILPHIRLFEMPIVGYGGFPAFAVEVYVMYIAVRRWLWRASLRPIPL